VPRGILWRVGTVPRGIPCRVGYRAAWDTVPRGMPCRVGYRAAWDTVAGRSRFRKDAVPVGSGQQGQVRPPEVLSTQSTLLPSIPLRHVTKPTYWIQRNVLHAGLAAQPIGSALCRSVWLLPQVHHARTVEPV
jgi:hypothetical protein